MGIKLVCFDLDGTINDAWDLVPALRAKMERLRNAGVKTAIITGRELLGSLYYIHNAKFPFDYLGPGGGSVIFDPLKIEMVKDLFHPENVKYIIQPGLSKTQRLLQVQKLAGVSDEELLFIDDNSGSGIQHDVREVLATVHCHLAAPRTNNQEWLDVVHQKKGFVSLRPCGHGTLEILNHYFPNV
jgi:hydroxymethylpyrimidine pyrophosphatase-like HAD family hydrolase